MAANRLGGTARKGHARLQLTRHPTQQRRRFTGISANQVVSGRGSGKREVEATPDTELAADPDPATVCHHNALRNRESQSGALVVGALGTPVTVEHTW